MRGGRKRVGGVFFPITLKGGSFSKLENMVDSRDQCDVI